MPFSRHHRQPSSGYSALEIVGLLATMALGVIVVLPRASSALTASRLTHAVGMIQATSRAVGDFSGRYGAIPVTPRETKLDDLLIAAGSLAAPFQVKVGAQVRSPASGGTWTRTIDGWITSGGFDQGSQTRLINLPVAPRDLPGEGTNYWLEALISLPAGATVASAVIVGATAREALELSRRIDGAELSELGTDSADRRGRVTYATSHGETRIVYVYLAHR